MGMNNNTQKAMSTSEAEVFNFLTEQEAQGNPHAAPFLVLWDHLATSGPGQGSDCGLLATFIKKGGLLSFGDKYTAALTSWIMSHGIYQGHPVEDVRNLHLNAG